MPITEWDPAFVALAGAASLGLAYLAGSVVLLIEAAMRDRRIREGQRTNAEVQRLILAHLATTFSDPLIQERLKRAPAPVVLAQILEVAQAVDPARVQRLARLLRRLHMTRSVRARLTSGRWEERLDAARIVNHLGLDVPEMARLLHDDAPLVQEQAFLWAVNHGNAADLSAVVQAYSRGHNQHVALDVMERRPSECRNAVEQALRTGGDPAALLRACHVMDHLPKSWESFVDHEDPHVRAALAGTLTYDRSSALERLRSDPDATVRRAACRRSSDLGIDVTRMLMDADWRVGREAAIGLVRSGMSCPLVSSVGKVGVARYQHAASWMEVAS